MNKSPELSLARQIIVPFALRNFTVNEFYSGKNKTKINEKKNIYTYQQSIAIRCMQRFFFL